MDLNTILRYKGCLNTPALWKDNSVEGLNQLDLVNNIDENNDYTRLFTNKRLGKLVEEFIGYQISKNTNVSWIVSNLQIQNEKITVGELDALFYKHKKPIHLEIIYKFYLYDNKISKNDELKNWIGPNRKDALVYKLDKLLKKQLPLLYNTKTKLYLDNLNLKANEIKQEVCFKAQLFLPYEIPKFNSNLINRDCVMGFYISIKKLNIFEAYNFHIPNKLDWLITPHLDVKWLNFKDAKAEINKHINQNQSPLCWLNYKNKVLEKCFVTWW
ncbi:DUF1853 family protein [Winogradskyella sp.]|nr:DUF1853 family protein [Winogradskyella sp.]